VPAARSSSRARKRTEGNAPLGELEVAQRDGDDKPTKVPVAPATGGPAATNDASTGAHLPTPTAASLTTPESRESDLFLPMATHSSGSILITLSDEAGHMSALACDIVKRLQSYTELSVSGRGIHVIVKATMPDGRGRKNSATGVEATAADDIL